MEGFPVLKKAMDKYAPDKLTYSSVCFDEENHSSITLAALTKGLRYLLA